jgi:hypothetical protein
MVIDAQRPGYWFESGHLNFLLMRGNVKENKGSVATAPANFRLKPEPPSATIRAEPSRHGLSRQFSRLPLSRLSGLSRLSRHFFAPHFFFLSLSVYREHLLSIDHIKCLYHQVDTPDGRRSLRAPPFFVAQTNKGFFFLPGSEAECQMSFFAQSLTAALPAAYIHIPNPSLQ